MYYYMGMYTLAASANDDDVINFVFKNDAMVDPKCKLNINAG